MNCLLVNILFCNNQACLVYLLPSRKTIACFDNSKLFFYILFYFCTTLPYYCTCFFKNRELVICMLLLPVDQVVKQTTAEQLEIRMNNTFSLRVSKKRSGDKRNSPVMCKIISCNGVGWTGHSFIRTLKFDRQTNLYLKVNCLMHSVFSILNSIFQDILLR